MIEKYLVLFLLILQSFVTSFSTLQPAYVAEVFHSLSKICFLLIVFHKLDLIFRRLLVILLTFSF